MENNKSLSNVKPLQRLSYKDKTKNDNKWFKECADYFIGQSGYLNSTGTSLPNNEITRLVGIYHNDIPSELFKSFLNPLNSTNEKYKTKNAKIRPMNIIKANIDFINSNYAKRVFNYQCVNLDVDAYNEYQQNINDQFSKIVMQRFVQLINDETGQQKEQDLTPSKIKEELSLSYKDILADKAQTFINSLVKQNHVHETMCDLFLDYLIHGEPVSFRGIVNDKFCYRRVDRKMFSYGKSPNEKYSENAEWQVEVELKTVSDVISQYYDKLDDDMWEKLDANSSLSTENVSNFLSNRFTDSDNLSTTSSGRIQVHHVYWVSRKKIGKRTALDEETGIIEVDEVDENYKPSEDEYVEWYWKDCIYHADKIANTIYIDMGEYRYDFADISADGKIRLPYNSFKFSHFYDAKIYSVLKMGLPYLTMFLICNFVIEKLLAKNKGRILLIDWNAIPKTMGWDEERFMYYCEEMGYGFVDRNNQDVDKSYNQYQSVDMSTLSSVMDMINLANSYKALWDDIIGIPRQMRGQMTASDQVGTTNNAISQSGIGIDYIYQKFDNFTNREFEYFLELSKYLIIDSNGHNSVQYDDDTFKILNINPEEICYAKLKIIPVNNAKENKELDRAKQYAETVNQQDPAMIIEILTADSMSALKKKLATIASKMQAQQEQATQAEHENAKELIEAQKDIKKFESFLEGELDTLKTNNKIRAEIEISNGVMMPDKDNDRDGIPDILEAQYKNAVENQKIALGNKIADNDREVALKKIEADKQKNNSKK
jgi:hypothetical protein